jgi:hypothetical protein
MLRKVERSLSLEQFLDHGLLKADILAFWMISSNWVLEVKSRIFVIQASLGAS